MSNFSNKRGRRLVTLSDASIEALLRHKATLSARLRSGRGGHRVGQATTLRAQMRTVRKSEEPAQIPKSGMSARQENINRLSLVRAGPLRGTAK
jgi:hypothetical protein